MITYVRNRAAEFSPGVVPDLPTAEVECTHRRLWRLIIQTF